MVSIIYVEPSGKRQKVDVTEGWSLMQGATANGVEGIVGECGGSCACGTCHCYVDEARLADLPTPDNNENDVLDGSGRGEAKQSTLMPDQGDRRTRWAGRDPAGDAGIARQHAGIGLATNGGDECP
jgi:2Fe-2S ferredoxin